MQNNSPIIEINVIGTGEDGIIFPNYWDDGTLWDSAVSWDTAIIDNTKPLIEINP